MFILSFSIFNAASDSSSASAGTPDYLPPEVISGHRKDAAYADDIWAISLLIWRIFHGPKSTAQPGSKTHALITTEPPDRVIQLLLKALSIEIDNRPPDAKSLSQQIEEAFAPQQKPSNEQTIKEHVDSVSTTRIDLQAARTAEIRIRNSIIDTLDTSDMVPVPKEIRELVALALETSIDGSTTAIDLTSDLVGLGPKALPALIEQSYKLSVDSSEWEHASKALSELMVNEDDLAKKSIRHYCVSSSYAVRSMCLKGCENLNYIPDELPDLLTNEDGLLGRTERQRILDLIFRNASELNEILILTQLMCHLVIIDNTNYINLRNTIATRLSEIRTEVDIPTILFEDAENKIWKDSREYKKTNPAKQNDFDQSATRLIGDAFASFDNAVYKLKNRYMVSAKTRLESWPDTVWWTFTQCVISAKPDSLEVLKKFAEQLGDTRLQNNLKRLEEREPLDESEIEPLVNDFLEGVDSSRNTYNKIRFERSGQAVKIISEALLENSTEETCRNVLMLLAGFESRCRNSVIYCMLNHWPLLSDHSLERSCNVFSQATIRHEDVKRKVIDLLNNELEKNGESCVRDTLNKVLSGA